MRTRILKDPHFAYLTWLNDFLTIDYFAKYFDIPKCDAKTLIQTGKQIHYTLNP
jgi:hypothetical protein